MMGGIVAITSTHCAKHLLLRELKELVMNRSISPSKLHMHSGFKDSFHPGLSMRYEQLLYLPIV